MRCWLFVPGHEERKATKALDTDADFVILDWEDAVPAAEKSRARRVTLERASILEDVSRFVVRVNSPRSGYFEDDLRALEALGERLAEIPAIVLPKSEESSEVEALATLGRPMVLLIESARGVERAHDLARCHSLVQRLAFGPLDLLADVGGHWTQEGEEHLYARSRVVIADRAAGLDGALDGPYPRLEDLDGLRDDASRGRRLGYVGKMLIHPRQIAVVREVFAPTPEEQEFAHKVLEAAAKAKAAGRGATSIDGRFVDGPVIKWARRVVAETES